MSDPTNVQHHDQAMDAFTVLQEQMNAYNRRDLESFCSHFAPDIVSRLYETGEVLSTGLAETRELYKDFACYVVKAPRSINSDIKKRGDIGELIVVSWERAGVREVRVA